MARIFRYTAAGMLGALMAWAIVEMAGLATMVERPEGVVTFLLGAAITRHQIADFMIGLLFGVFVGTLMGVAEALGGMSRQDAKMVTMGTLVGAAGGVLGLALATPFTACVPACRHSGASFRRRCTRNTGIESAGFCAPPDRARRRMGLAGRVYRLFAGSPPVRPRR